MFLDCMKNRFDCASDIARLEGEKKAAESRLQHCRSALVSLQIKYKASCPFEHLPDTGHLLNTGKAVLCTTSQFQAQWKKQFGRRLSNYPGDDTIQWTALGYYHLRVSMKIIQEFLRYSKVNEVKYRLPNPPNDPVGHVCGDFAGRLYSQVNDSKYYAACIGAVMIKGHWLAWCWPADREEIHFIDEYTDRVFIPTLIDDKYMPKLIVS